MRVIDIMQKKSFYSAHTQLMWKVKILCSGADFLPTKEDAGKSLRHTHVKGEDTEPSMSILVIYTKSFIRL